MNPENFTTRSQEAIKKAFSLARDSQHQAVETGHLLRALLNSGDGIAEQLLKKSGVQAAAISEKLDRVINSYPRITGGEQYISQETNRALQKALDSSKGMKDQFVSVEHMLIGLMSVGDSISKLLKDSGLNEKELTSSIMDYRNGKKADTQSAED